MIQLNLVPSVKQEFLKAQRAKRIIVLTALGVGGFFLSIVIILTISVYVVQKQHISNLETDIDQQIDELQAIPDLDKILTVQSQLKALPALHSQDPEASRFFKYLSQLTPDDVVLDSTSITSGQGAGGEAVIQLSGRAVGFKAVNRFVDTIKNSTYEDPANPGTAVPAFPAVVLTSIGQDTNADSKYSTNFSVGFSFDPIIFSPDQKVKLSIPSIASTVSRKEKPTVFSEESE